MPEAGRRWSRSEVLIAFNIYCRTPFGKLHARNPEIVKIAERLGRTPGALAMKCCNIASFDPAQQARGIKGLSKASQVDSEVWNSFERDPEQTGYESETQYAEAVGEEPRMTEGVEWEGVSGLDRLAVVKVRVNQTLFRAIILSGYGSECAVCGLGIPQLLVASHIVPWAFDKSLRMNPQNGLCLCALHDRAFDKGLLRVGPDYRVSLSEFVLAQRSDKAVTQHLLVYERAEIKLPERWHPDPELLSRHLATAELTNP
ncbi:HNH endonuclease [Blastopirellula marina]|uniref:Restriction endonuclease n=1 Tax=Blastopirellula marina TaxID=124 RepID=A0A2S8GMT0_9BACT|nr:HNH endonuclease [Blastopirellula marina]PQO45728.1 restriction endonuclease [Blastopirellula marina]